MPWSKSRVLFAIACIGSILPVLAIAQDLPESARNYCGPHMYGWGGGGHGMFFGPFFMVLSIAATVAFAVFWIRNYSGPEVGRWWTHPGASGPSPLEILQARFARGEISKEEFEESRKVLGV